MRFLRLVEDDDSGNSQRWVLLCDWYNNRWEKERAAAQG